MVEVHGIAGKKSHPQIVGNTSGFLASRWVWLRQQQMKKNNESRLSKDSLRGICTASLSLSILCLGTVGLRAQVQSSLHGMLGGGFNCNVSEGVDLIVAVVVFDRRRLSAKMGEFRNGKMRLKGSRGRDKPCQRTTGSSVM